MPNEAPTPEEMIAGVRSAVGNRGDIARNLGLPGEQSHVIRGAYEQVRADQGKGALDALAGGAPGFTRGGWEDILKDQIYTGFDAAGNRLASNATETTRFTQARRMMKAYEDYMAHGYDGLRGTAVEVGNKRTVLREQMHDFLVSNPTFRAALTPAWATHTIPTAVLEEALRDEALGRELAITLNAKFDPDSPANAGTAAGVFTARTTRETAVQSRRLLNQQRDRQNYRLTQATADRNNFNTIANYTVGSIVPPRPAETRASALTALEGDMATSANPDVQTFKANLVQRDNLREQLAGEGLSAAQRTALTHNLTDAQASLTRARADVHHGRHCGEFENLYEQRRDIQNRIDAASQEVARLSGDIATQDIAVAGAHAAINTGATKDRAKSGDFALTVGQAFHEAAKKYLAGRTKKFIETYRPTRGKVISDASAENERQMDQYMARRWINYRPRSFLHNWHAATTSVNKRQTRNDFTRFMGQGVDVVIADILRQSGIPASKAALMMQDKSEGGFMDTKRAEVIGKILSAYVVSGGKLKKSHLDTIAMSEYGKDAVASMKRVSEDQRDRISQAMEAGYTRGVPKDLRERMIEGAPPWLVTKTTLQILLSPMRLLRPGAIEIGKLFRTIDVT